jgi:hypothetical protein
MLNLYKVIPFSFFLWAEHTHIALYIKGSTWAFAIIETTHIIGLSILLGATLIVDLRLLGKGLTRQTIPEVSDTLMRCTWITFFVVVATGWALYSSEAIRLSKSGPFFYKMVFLLIAIIIHMTIHRKATSPGAPEGTGMARAAAILSLCCWLGVALAGRAIAFL